MKKPNGCLLRNLGMSLPFLVVLVLSACDNATSSSEPGKLSPAASSAPANTGAQGALDRASENEVLNQPNGLATDGNNLYVADTANNKIRKVAIATGDVTALAGGGTEGLADGGKTAALFSQPFGVAVDGANLYVADSGNNLIRKVVIATGEVSTLAGLADGGDADGKGTMASFKGPMGVAADGPNLFVADYYNNKIRKIVIASGEVTTLAGSGKEGAVDGIGAAALFNHPIGVTTDGSNLYVSDYSNHKIRKIVIATGEVTTLAGSGSSGAADGVGSAASFNNPGHLVADGNSLYVADTYNQKIRKIVIATGEVTTLAGMGVAAAAQTEKFDSPFGMATVGGNLYVSDTESNTIRKVAISTGQVTTLQAKETDAGSESAPKSGQQAKSSLEPVTAEAANTAAPENDSPAITANNDNPVAEDANTMPAKHRKAKKSKKAKRAESVQTNYPDVVQ